MMFSRLKAIIDFPGIDLRELAEVAGADPRTFYRGANFGGADLRSTDLSDYDLTRASFAGAVTELEFDGLGIPGEETITGKEKVFIRSGMLDREIVGRVDSWRMQLMRSKSQRMLTIIAFGIREGFDVVAIDYDDGLTKNYLSSTTIYMPSHIKKEIRHRSAKIGVPMSWFCASMIDHVVKHKNIWSQLEAELIQSEGKFLYQYNNEMKIRHG